MPLNEIKLLANAKLNLALDITGVREDGYHLMNMVNRSVDLCDTVTLSRTARADLTVSSNARFLPRDGRNLTVKALRALEMHTERKFPGVHIAIKKRIPTQAGLGGGSADAAAVLVGLNALFALNLPTETLCRVGETVGADVPFCVAGGATRVTGIGEELAPLEDRCEYSLVIVMPSHGHSTRAAFETFDAGVAYERPDIDGLCACLEDGDIGGMAMRVGNAFHAVAPRPETTRLIAQLLSHGALGASMTGSGAAVFGIFSAHLDAQHCCSVLRRRGLRAFTARPCGDGVQILPKNR